MSVLDQDPRGGIEEYLAECATVGGVDTAVVRDVANRTITYLRAPLAARLKLREEQRLEQAWYASLDSGTPLWKVYDTDLYLADLWACWVVYSREYVKAARHPKSLPGGSIMQSLGEVRSVVDLGCGIGWTTSAMTELWPRAAVAGTNFPGQKQTRIAEARGKRYGFTVRSDPRVLKGGVDLVCAFEYFEHIPEPVDHLAQVITHLRPRAFLIANAFNAKSIGHFDSYLVNGMHLSGKQTGKRFGQELVMRGYRKVPTKLWNNRPQYWVRYG